MNTNDSIGFLDCEVEELKTSTKQACIFPFEFNQTLFSGCTTGFEPQNKSWCATKIDEKGLAVEGYKGHCNETCPLDVNGTSNSIINLIKILLGGKLT